MSLLMDALKRAETAKQEAARAQFGIAPGTPPTSPTLSLEPLPGEAGNTATKPLPDLATYIDAVDADLASTTSLPKAAPPPAPAATPSPAVAADNTQRETVRNAFAAKQQPVADKPSRLPLWLALGTLAIAGTGIGGYVWYQLNALNRGSQLSPPPAPRPLAQAQPTLPTVASPSVAPLAPRSEEPALFAPRREAPPAKAVRDDADNAIPIRLTRSQPAIDPALARGHASLQRGEIDLARREFEQTLRRDPNNTDALLALASIAQRQGRGAEAETLRQRALVANPADPAAQAAALSGSTAETDPQTTESRLKGLLSAQPESAPLNFALGNLYARQARWAEAQQVYFNAVAADGDNPDYLFNLAVSLDHLRQPRLAGQHYRMALEAAARRPAAFDRAGVEKRLGELMPERAR